jgi:hypothetical protein
MPRTITFLQVLLALSLAISALGIVSSATLEAQLTSQAAERDRAGAKIDAQLSKWWQWMTLQRALPEPGDQNARATLERRVTNARDTLHRTCGWFVLTVIILSGLAIAAGKKKRVRLLAITALWTAALSLAIGVLTPFLLVSVYQDLPLLGRTLLSHESKGLTDTIGELVHTNQLPIALLLGLFSLAFPIVKLVLSAVALLDPSHPIARLAADFVHHIGKWSMTDVFVVAVFIVFLTTSQTVESEAKVGVGLYFFAAHSVLALIAGELMGWGSRSRPSVGPYH